MCGHEQNVAEVRSRWYSYWKATYGIQSSSDKADRSLVPSDRSEARDRILYL